MRLYVVMIFVAFLFQDCSDNERIFSDVKLIVDKLNADAGKWMSCWGYDTVVIDDLVQSGRQNLEWRDASSNGSFIDKKLRVYTKDSISFIDIYSGSYVLDSTSQYPELIEEPESIVKVLYRNNIGELLHYGYSAVFQDAFWLKEDAFMVVGYEMDETGASVPRIWAFDLQKHLILIYSFKPRKEMGEDYIKKKILNVLGNSTQ